MRHWKGFFRYFVVKLKTSSIPILHPLFSNCQLLTINQFYLITTLTFRGNSRFYYIDMIILPKNGQLVFSIRNYIRVTSEIFSISSIVKISLTSSFVFPSYFFYYFWDTHIYVIKRKLHVGLKICSLSSSGKNISRVSERSCTHSWNIFPLEDKLHIFAPPCHILNLLTNTNDWK